MLPSSSRHADQTRVPGQTPTSDVDPGAIYFTLVPTSRTQPRFAPYLFTVVNSVPIYRSIDPEAGQSFVAWGSLLLANGRSPTDVFRLLGDESAGLVVDPTLSLLSPRADVFLPLSLSLALLERLPPTFFAPDVLQDVKRLLEVGGRKMGSWYEEGSVVHNWRPVDTKFEIGSARGLFATALPVKVEIVHKDHYIRTPIGPTDLAPFVDAHPMGFPPDALAVWNAFVRLACLAQTTLQASLDVPPRGPSAASSDEEGDEEEDLGLVGGGVTDDVLLALCDPLLSALAPSSVGPSATRTVENAIRAGRRTTFPNLSREEGRREAASVGWALVDLLGTLVSAWMRERLLPPRPPTTFSARSPVGRELTRRWFVGAPPEVPIGPRVEDGQREVVASVGRLETVLQRELDRMRDAFSEDVGRLGRELMTSMSEVRDVSRPRRTPSPDRLPKDTPPESPAPAHPPPPRTLTTLLSAFLVLSLLLNVLFLSSRTYWPFRAPSTDVLAPSHGWTADAIHINRQAVLRLLEHFTNDS